MKAAYSRTSYLKLLEHLVVGQRKSRMLILLQGVDPDHAGSSLSYNEGLLLYLLQSSPDQNVKDLSEALTLERSWVSRIVSSLEERGYVESFIPPADRRSKKLRLTDTGKQELHHMSTFRRQVMDERLKELSQKEQKDLAALIGKMSDSLGAPRDVFYDDGHPVDAQLARLSWAIGVVGNSFFGSDLSVTQYQLFHCIVSFDREEILTTQLFERLPFDLSTISRTLASFARNGFIEKKTSENDRRSFTVSLKEKGKKLWADIEKEGVQILTTALKDFSEKEVERLIDLLEKSNRILPTRLKHDSIEKLELKRATSPQTLEQSELFLKKRLAPGSSSKPSSGQAKRERFTISIDDEIKAVVDVTRSSKDGSLQNFVFAAENLPEKDCIQLVRSCISAS